jgi:DNA-directed RNA polymerase specialized sigma24 family protein
MSATDEQLDYLRWFLGGTDEYPTYGEDKYGRVMTPGYRNEVSLDALVADDDYIDGTPVVKSDLPSPDDAIAKYFGDARLSTLSKRERQAFILRSVCDMWPREIAEYLGINVESVKKRLVRAGEKLAR